jgi:small subunit ribosomal protein S9
MLIRQIFAVRGVQQIFRAAAASCRDIASRYATGLPSIRSYSSIRAAPLGDVLDEEDDGVHLESDGHDDFDPADNIIEKLPVIDEFGRSYGTGKRKTSIARVWVKSGSGEFIVNDKTLADYFQPLQRMHAIEAFQASKTAGLFDVWCTVKGGGISGQAGAVRLGISRALVAFDPSLRPLLSRAGMMNRDSRRVERKKPGQKKARKKFQVRIYSHQQFVCYVLILFAVGQEIVVHSWVSSPTDNSTRKRIVYLVV